MRVGHIIALVGALMVLLGGTVFGWQAFDLAGVTAAGYEVPAGQAILALGAVLILSSLVGLLTKKRYQMATVTLVTAVFAVGWLIFAHVSRHDTFVLMPYEAVEMLGGYTIAVWGAVLMCLGPLVVFASEPAWNPNSQYLRVALLWGDTVIEERVLQEATTFTVGDDIRNDFVFEDDKLPTQFPLFRAGKKNEYAIGLTSELQGQVTVNQQTEEISAFVEKATSTEGAVHYVPIGMGDWGMVHLTESMRVFFQFVQPDRGGARKGLVAFDETVTASIGVSMFAQVAFVVLGVLLWQENAEREKYVEPLRDADIEAQVMTRDEPEPELEEETEEEEEVSKKAGGEEGKFGDPDEDPEKESKIPKLDARMVDKIDVKKVGLNDLLSTNKLGGSGAISEILNATSEGMSNKLAVAMAGEGSEFVIGAGAGGMGFTGDGGGGGGQGVGRIQGMGNIDTGAGMGIKAGLGKKGKKRVGKLNVGSGTSTGFCKKSAIASVVRRRAGAIRACYEQRLQVKKTLQGKLTAQWTIQMDGSVKGVTSQQNSLGDSATTNCILRILRRMRFAKPEGGFCVVRWPFVFAPG